mmetsp:Transcript_29906/g.91592  ORF Transcript_29906/g.91592 Transcript_29906/m.91592 type:complete len:204 (+) Transcript_29906:78-689(+)
MRAMHHNHHRRNDRVPLSRGERRVRTCFEEERRSVSRRGRWRRLRGLVATWIARRPSCRRCAGAWSAGRTAGRAAAAARPTASRPRAWDVAPGWSRLRRGVSFRTILKKKEYLVGAPSRRSRPRGRCCCRGRRGAGPGRPCPSRAGRRTPSYEERVKDVTRRGTYCLEMRASLPPKARSGTESSPPNSSWMEAERRSRTLLGT